MIFSAGIVNQHTGIGHIIGMVVLNLEIINLDWAFQQFVLNLLHNDIFAVDEDKDISGAEMYRIRPALHRGIERMSRRCNNFLAVYKNVNQFIRLIDVGLHNLLQRNIFRVFIPGPDVVAHLYGLYGRSACRCQYCCTGYEAIWRAYRARNRTGYRTRHKARGGPIQGCLPGSFPAACGDSVCYRS